jgi:hypothetical protein
MIDDFKGLKGRTQELGNHHRKYLHLIEAQHGLLTERLENSGRIDEVHLWSASPDVASEMTVVCEMGRDEQEKLSFLGCYFGVQMLTLNLSAVDVLRLGLSSGANRYHLYRDFMLQMGADLRRLTAAYMEKLLELFLPPEERPEFVICGVGTRADQDDLDLGIVDDGSERRESLTRAVGRVQREMLRRAIPLHMYLAEHIGLEGFSATIEEFCAVLDVQIQDFVIITEMLGARPILGSRGLFGRFTREVTDRYYYSPGGDNRFHEGYLRGMLGEVRSLMLWEMRRDSIHPKQDALRIIKGIIFAQKTVHGIERANAWNILRQLAAHDPGHRQVYETLENSLSFIEVFRFLYQILEVQEEEVFLADEGSRAQLESVAELMGYHDIGVVRAHDHLLIHYHEHVQAAREAASVLLADLRKHLEAISVFSALLRRRETEQAEDENLAITFVETLRFFKGTKFWDDVMGPMEAEDGELLQSFVEDFEALPADERAIWIQRYAKWGELTILAIFRLLVVLHRRRRKMKSLWLYKELCPAFIDRIRNMPEVIPRLTAVFHHYPQLANDFLTILDEEYLRRFMTVLDGETWSEEVEVLRRRMLAFCELHYVSSHYFKRFFQRIVERYPQYIQYFDRPDRLRIIAKGIFARIGTVPSYTQKKEELGSFYDLEFLRVGLECIDGAPSDKTNAEFTEFSDRYLRALFDVCKQEVRHEWSERVHTRDLLALYSAGGHGRKLAFDDDYDLIILLNSDDPEIRRYCGRIITRMNREIIRRGTMPQYRFADHFGEYVTTVSQLRSLFSSDEEHVFIDMSQVLGARRIVGSQKFEQDLHAQVIGPLIMSRVDAFTAQLAAEIRSRHAAVEEGIISSLNVKEAKGGLRDIELLMMILMAFAGITHPVSHDLLEPLVEAIPERETELRKLFRTFRYLKRRRDLYRLTVAAEDDILRDQTGHMARILGYCVDPEECDGRQIMVRELEQTMAGNDAMVRSILVDVGLWEA